MRLLLFLFHVGAALQAIWDEGYVPKRPLISLFLDPSQSLLFLELTLVSRNCVPPPRNMRDAIIPIFSELSSAEISEQPSGRIVSDKSRSTDSVADESSRRVL